MQAPYLHSSDRFLEADGAEIFTGEIENTVVQKSIVDSHKLSYVKRGL